MNFALISLSLSFNYFEEGQREVYLKNSLSEKGNSFAEYDVLLKGGN